MINEEFAGQLNEFKRLVELDRQLMHIDTKFKMFMAFAHSLPAEEQAIEFKKLQVESTKIQHELKELRDKSDKILNKK